MKILSGLVNMGRAKDFVKIFKYPTVAIFYNNSLSRDIWVYEKWRAHVPFLVLRSKLYVEVNLRYNELTWDIINNFKYTWQ